MSGIGEQANQALSSVNFAAVVVDVSSGRIVGASPAAASTLAPGESSVVGSLFEDFTADEPLGERELFRTGRVTGFEAIRMLARPGGGVPVRVWLHRFDHQPPSAFVLIMLVPEDEAGSEHGRPRQHEVGEDDVTGVAGTADELLQVAQLSEATAPLFGLSPSGLVGRPLLNLLAPEDRSRVLAGIAEAAETGTGVTLYVDVCRVGAEPTTVSAGCELLILPLSPSPSCFFTFLPTNAQLPRARLSEDMGAILARMLHGVQESPRRALTAGTSPTALAGASDLTSREREVLDLLVAGGRVSTIARTLFLAESTVRTHVASAERKLGAADQRELVDLVLGHHDAGGPDQG